MALLNFDVAEEESAQSLRALALAPAADEPPSEDSLRACRRTPKVGGVKVRRAVLVFTTTVLLLTASFSTSGIALGDVEVTLDCSGGNTVTLLADTQTVTELTDAVAAMSGSGLDCTITQVPVMLSLFGLTALADSNGSKDFAVGGGQYNADGICGPLPTTINIGFSAHVPADGSMPDSATGSISETVSQPGGPCDGDRRKVTVTCLEVGPNPNILAGGTLGWMDGTVTQATGYFLGSFTLGLTAWDKPTKPDYFNDNRNLPNCQSHVLQPTFEFFHGNIVVKDR